MNAAAKRRVLIVDDENSIADTLALIFANSGFETRTAYSAERALEQAQQWLPDLAIIDVILPEMHGLDLALRLTQMNPDCKLIIFSGQPSTGDLVSQPAYSEYAFQIIAKPIHPRDLLAEASKLLAEAAGN